MNPSEGAANFEVPGPVDGGAGAGAGAVSTRAGFLPDSHCSLTYIIY